MINLGIRCPKCGQSYYTIINTISTAMYSPTIVKDGAIVSNDPNYITYYCSCIACGALFSYQEKSGNVINISLDAGIPSVSSEVAVSRGQNITAATSENSTTMALARDLIIGDNYGKISI